MRFEVLGQLRAVVDSDVVGLGSEKRRRLLGVLLSKAGQPVPTDVLLEALWGVPRLDSARNTLHWHVHQLRKALPEPEMVTHGGNEYTLRIDPELVDAHRFETLHREGGRVLADGDVKTASRLLGEAIGLWRDRVAYADLQDCPLLQAEAQRLAELRLHAVEQHCDCELALGNHASLIPSLTTMVAEQPLRDGLRARLMLSLYRSGRQAEALESYRDGRDRYDRQLGLEPGSELTRLERAILRQDPALNPKPPASIGTTRPASSRAVPNELPADLTAFTGRADVVERIGRQLRLDDCGAVVHALTGTGGIGKSALAVHIAHRVAVAFPDGNLYVNLRGATPEVPPLRPAEVLHRLLRSLDVPAGHLGQDTEELAARFRSATADKRIMLVLDDARDVAQVRPLLPGGAGCGVLVTSRRSLSTLSNSRMVRLPGLTADEAVVMLRRLLGDSRVDCEVEAVDRLVRLCDGLPLALSLAAAKLAGRPDRSVESYVDMLSTEGHRLNELAADDQAVRACFLVGYRELADDPQGLSARRLFAALGLTEGTDIDVAAAAALAELDVHDTRGLLDVLAEAALIDCQATGRYAMHDLLRLYARECAAELLAPAEAAAALTRLHHHYLATVRAAVNMLHPQRYWRTVFGRQDLCRPPLVLVSNADAAQWIDAETENIVAAARQSCAGLGADSLTGFALAASLNSRLSMRGRVEQQDRLTAVALTAAVRLNDPDTLAFAHYDRAETLELMGNRDEALRSMRLALEAAELGTDELLRGRVLKALAYYHKLHGELDTAIEFANRGLDIHRAHGNHLGQAHGLVILGVIHRQAGRHDASIKAQLEATAIVTAHGDSSAQALMAGNLAEAYLAGGRLREAVEFFDRALELDRPANLLGTRWEAVHLWGLGEALYLRDETDQARKHWSDAASILFELKVIDASERAAIQADPYPDKPTILST